VPVACVTARQSTHGQLHSCIASAKPVVAVAAPGQTEVPSPAVSSLRVASAQLTLSIHFRFYSTAQRVWVLERAVSLLPLIDGQITNDPKAVGYKNSSMNGANKLYARIRYVPTL